MAATALDFASPQVSNDTTSSRSALVDEYLAFSPPSSRNTVASETTAYPKFHKTVEGRENENGPDTIPGKKPDKKVEKKENDKPGDPKNDLCPDFKFKGELYLIGGNANNTWYELVKRLPENPKIVLVTLASREPGQNEALAKDFEDVGIPAKNITVISDEPTPANTKYNYSKSLPDDFNMIYFSGGDQAVLRQRFTEVDKLRAALEKGAVVAGNSAGTAIMPCEMITGGGPGDLTHSRGFGLTPWAVTDTHVHERGREDRDVSALYEIGKGELPVIGIDGDTRVIFRWEDGHLIGEVGGKESVRVFRKPDQDLKVVSNRKIVPDLIQGTDGAGKGKSARVWELKKGDKFILR